MCEISSRSAATLEKHAKEYGGTVANESSGKMKVYQCESPAGNVWASSSTHCLRVEWRDGDTVDRHKAIEEAICRMADGVTECDDEECDYCHPESEA